MRNIGTLALVALTVFATGCYFSYPKLPSRPRPTVEQGEEVEISTQEHSYNKSCQPGSSGCGLASDGTWKKRRRYDTISARYRGQTLTQFEVQRLVNPEFEAKFKRIVDRKSVCNLSLIPSAIAVATIIGGALAQDQINAAFGDRKQVAYAVIAGTALGSALLSYPLGGYACSAAHDEWKALMNGVDPDDKDLDVSTSNQSYITETRKLAEEFNRQFGRKQPAAPE
jgi:hypothetical protein